MASGSVTLLMMGMPEAKGLPGDVVFPAKAFQLIAYLAANPQKPHSRKFLASLLWDSVSEETALTNFRQLLSRIRRLLPDDQAPFSADNHSVTFQPSSTMIDRLQFDDLLGSAELKERLSGLELVRGELLEFATDLAAPFHEWLVIERASMREVFFAACTDALKELTRYGSAPAGALRRVERLMLAFDSEREETYRSLIEAHGQVGEFEESERLFQSLKSILAHESGSAPSAGTASVMRRIASARVVSSSSEPPKLPGKSAAPRVGLLMPALSIAGYTAPLVRALIEDVANELTRYRSFSVIAPHSSMSAQHDSGVPLDNSLLKLDYTVSGIFKPSSRGDCLALRLVRLDNSEIVWVGDFGVDNTALHETSWQLTKQIASTIASSLERSILEQRRSSGRVDAYFHYLQGREAQLGCDLPKVRRARKEFVRAIALDARYAQARARLAETLFVEWILLGGADASLLAEARRQANQSISDDPGAAIGHWVSGAVSLYQRDYDVVQTRFKDAEVLAPNCADLLLEHGDALSHLGEHDASLEKFNRAMELNPTPPDRYWWFGGSMAFAREDFEGAIQLCEKISSDEVAVGLRAAAYAMAGRREEAQFWGNRVREVLPQMKLSDFAKMSPTRNPNDKINYLAGLRIAGIT